MTRARMRFIVDDGEMPASVTAGPHGQIEHRGNYEEHSLDLLDWRASAISLDREGFVVTAHDTEVKDFHDQDEVASIYHREVEALVKAQTGCARVHVGDEAELDAKGLREPLAVAHNDYTHESGPSRLRLALPEEADTLLERRFAIVQVWRPTHETILDRPLALCDSSSVPPECLIRTERRHRDRVGYTYNLSFDARQRWGWFPELRREEAIVFKVYDSKEDGARFTPHGSPLLEEIPPGAPPRRSIEVRTLALF